MKNIVTISGWGQDSDALENIAPGAKHIAYRDFKNVDELFSSLKKQDCDVLIGWSLGGQLALRAIDAGIFSPKLLVLLAAPFQFIVGRGLKCGIDIDTFQSFRKEFANDAGKTLKQFATLVGKNDTKAKEIITKLKNVNIDNAENWQYWLEELGDFSCQVLNFAKIPATLGIQGRDDTIVDYTQVGIFHPLIQNYKSVIFEGCGHAPHLHDAEKVRELIKEAYDNLKK